MALLTLVMAAAAYLIGSLSAAIIVSRWLGMDDPRTYGSGNPGASNMLRSGRKDAAAWTLAGDALKGVIAIGIAACLRNWLDLGDGIVAFTAIAVVVGHMWPLFFNFQGGKGVATALGVLLASSFWAAFWAFGIWFVIAYKFKKSSLAALIAASVAPFIFFIVEPHHPKVGWALVLIALLIWYRHKDNIKRLREGKELLIGETAQATHSDDAVVNQVMNETVETVSNAVEEAKTQAEEAVEKTVETVKEAAEKAEAKANEVFDKTVEKAKDVANAVEAKTNETVDAMKEKTEETVAKVAEKVEEKANEVANKAAEVAESAEESEESTEESDLPKPTRTDNH